MSRDRGGQEVAEGMSWLDELSKQIAGSAQDVKRQGGDEGLVLIKVTEGLDPLVLLMLAELVAAGVWG